MARDFCHRSRFGTRIKVAALRAAFATRRPYATPARQRASTSVVTIFIRLPRIPESRPKSRVGFTVKHVYLIIFNLSQFILVVGLGLCPEEVGFLSLPNMLRNEEMSTCDRIDKELQ